MEEMRISGGKLGPLRLPAQVMPVNYCSVVEGKKGVALERGGAY